MRNWATHEFLETNELLRKLTADIEFHAFCAEMAQDQELRGMLQRHVQAMDQTYHQAIQLLQDKGANTAAAQARYSYSRQQPHVGFQIPQPIPAPQTANVTRLSDVTIGTLILNSHKAGSMFGMLWANECADPEVRSFHVMCANNCERMAYEVWQYMNARGFYEVPIMPANDVRMMSQTYQPMNTGNAMEYTGFMNPHQMM